MADRGRPAGRGLGAGMIVAAWLLILGLMTLLFDDWIEDRRNPNRDLQSRVTDTGVREVVLERNRGGHYVAPGTVNGEPVTFIIDTGASDVSIPAELAGSAGLERGAPIVYQTANGRITAHATRVDRLRIGAIELNGVRGSLNPRMQGREVLLGMSVLERLELIQRGGTLTLRQSAAAP